MVNRWCPFTDNTETICCDCSFFFGLHCSCNAKSTANHEWVEINFVFSLRFFRSIFFHIRSSWVFQLTIFSSEKRATAFNMQSDPSRARSLTFQWKCVLWIGHCHKWNFNKSYWKERRKILKQLAHNTTYINWCVPEWTGPEHSRSYK